MINFYVYDTANGRVLGVGSYDETGDGAAGRALGLGVINPATEYAPGGVKTARPTFNLSTLLLDKSTIIANATDAATISGIPVGTLAQVFKDPQTRPRAAGVISDGNIVLRVDTPGTYRVKLSGFPTQDHTFVVNAT